jgi:hypothetical protein
MPFQASHEAMPTPTVEQVVNRTLTLRRQAIHPLRSRDTAAQEEASRRFLQRTQDVIVSAADYPGGLPALIRDRETVSLHFVRLLQND